MKTKHNFVHHLLVDGVHGCFSHRTFIVIIMIIEAKFVIMVIATYSLYPTHNVSYCNSHSWLYFHETPQPNNKSVLFLLFE